MLSAPITASCGGGTFSNSPQTEEAHGVGEAGINELARVINQVWSMDFMHVQLSNGRSFRLFNVIGDFIPEALGIDVDFSLPLDCVVRRL